MATKSKAAIRFEERVFPIGTAARFFDRTTTWLRWRENEGRLRDKRGRQVGGRRNNNKGGGGDRMYCVDADTQILTINGWKHYSELKLGELGLTLNTKTGLSEWQPLLAIWDFDWDDELVVMETTHHSSWTTPEHRWFVQMALGKQEQKWVTSDTFPRFGRIPCAAPCATLPTEIKYEDDFVELVGWYWSEGSLDQLKSYRRVSIGQSHIVNPENVKRIRKCLTRLLGPSKGPTTRTGSLHRSGGWDERSAWYEQKQQETMTYFYLGSVEPLLDVVRGKEKIIDPLFVASLTESQLRLLLDVCLLGDGNHAANGEISVNQTVRERLEALEMTCALLGLHTSVAFQKKTGDWKLLVRRAGTNTSPRSNEKRRKSKERRGAPTLENKFEWFFGRKKYTGKVWCVATPNSTFLARRRGNVYYTGNSLRDIKEMALSLHREGILDIENLDLVLGRIDSFSQPVRTRRLNAKDG